MKFLEQCLRWVVLIGIFCLPVVPLIVANGFFFPYITGKNFAFRIIVEIMAGAWLALALVFPQYRPRRSWILGTFTLFVAILLIADLQGVLPFKSIWSNFERMEGWVTLGHLLAYLCVLLSVMQTEDYWRWLFKWSLVISIFLSGVGLLQVAGLVALGQGGAGGLEARVDATFGNPIYLGVYVLFHVFLAFLLWVQMWNVRGEGKRMWPSIFYGTAITLDTIALFLTGTRGAMLGLIGGIFVALLLLAFRTGSDNKRMQYWVFGAIALFIVAGGAIRLAKDTPFVHDIGFLNRLSSISLSDATTKARFLNMGIALQGVKERPILGWGQENYAIVFDKYYDPRMYGQEQWFDRVHDSIFDWLIAGGILGLLSYVALFGAAIYTLWKSSAFAYIERSILTGLLLAHFAQNLTVFDNITSWILFATVLGYIGYRSASAQNASYIWKQEWLSRGSLAFVAPVCLVLAGIAVWGINGKAIAANQAIISALQPHQEGLATNLAAFEEAISYGTMGTQEAREQLAQITLQLISNANVPNDIKLQFVNASVRELDAQSTFSPQDARFPLFAGGVLDAAGDYKDGAAKLAKAHALSPAKQSILYEMGQNALLQNDLTTAVADFKQAYELDTENVTARVYYVALLVRSGNDAEADKIIAPIIKTGEAADKQIVSAYATRGEYQKLVPILLGAIAAAPTNQDNYITLAGVYYQIRDITNAVAILQKGESAIPSMKDQFDSLIAEVRAGTAPRQ